MKALIIEDEAVAAGALKTLITKVAPETEVIGVLQSIDESVEWFSSNSMPDLVFMDIHLADGSSFSIFDEVNISCPVIFTTAYDEYALKAFEVNSIDYLLKPISAHDLERAMHKYKNLASHSADNAQLLAGLMATLHKGSRSWKSYFLVPEKDKLIPLATDDIAVIFIDSKVVKALTYEDRAYYLDQTLDELAHQLDPELFFRANRQYIIARAAVKDLSVWFGSKLSVNMKVSVPDRIVISKARVPEFKKWFAN